MAKLKVSQWDSTAANNTDINSININEGCPPSTINNAIREVMAQIKNWQDGASGDDWTSAGTLNITGSLELDGSTGTAGQVLVSNGTATPTWGNAFVTGMIMLWSGSTGSVPSGWRLCDGGGGTPDLRNRFVVGAGSTYAVDATGGSANAVVVSHSHGASTTVNTKTGLNGTLTLLNRGGSSGAQSLMRARSGSVTYASSGQGNYGTGWEGEGGSNSSKATFTLNHNHSASTSVSSAGSSGTNKNLPPYYALAYIMKL
jgi:hypothetical protein